MSLLLLFAVLLFLLLLLSNAVARPNAPYATANGYRAWADDDVGTHVIRRLVLVGGGHAHIEVLREAARRPLAAEVIVVSPHARQLYTGMLPAQLRGHDAEQALAIELPALCRAARARFVEAAADRVEASLTGGAVHAGGAVIDGDVLSLDVGARAAGLDEVPGAMEHAQAGKPLGNWRRLVARLAEAIGARAPGDRVACGIVGGGPGGVELALAAHARIRGAGREPRVTIVDAGPRLLGGWRAGAAERVRELLDRRGIGVRTSVRVASVASACLTLADGSTVASDVTIWTTGAAALPLVRASGLPVDAGGFLCVDDTLRAVDGRAVWGAGDCVALAGAPWVPKAGVYAVREAPVLAHNLRVAVEGAGGAPRRYRRYRPQRHALALLDLADGSAFLYWRGVAVRGQLAYRLKRAIDERFVRRYQSAAGGT